MTRHSLELRTVAALVKTPRKGSALIRARYLKAMQAMGYSRVEAMQCFQDCHDMAELERVAA